MSVGSFELSGFSKMFIRSVAESRFSLSSTDLTAKNHDQVGYQHRFSLSSTDLTPKNCTQVGYQHPLFTLFNRPDSQKS